MKILRTMNLITRTLIMFVIIISLFVSLGSSFNFTRTNKNMTVNSSSDDSLTCHKSENNCVKFEETFIIEENLESVEGFLSNNLVIKVNIEDHLRNSPFLLPQILSMANEDTVNTWCLMEIKKLLQGIEGNNLWAIKGNFSI